MLGENHPIICKLRRLETAYPGILQKELFDFLDVLEAGAEKYDCNNWLEPDGKSASETDMHDKMFHHLARSFNDPQGWDADMFITQRKKLPHLLFLACRAMMLHTRRVRNLKHKEDNKA